MESIYFSAVGRKLSDQQKQHLSDHNAKNLARCVREVASNRARRLSQILSTYRRGALVLTSCEKGRRRSRQNHQRRQSPLCK